MLTCFCERLLISQLLSDYKQILLTSGIGFTSIIRYLLFLILKFVKVQTLACEVMKIMLVFSNILW